MKYGGRMPFMANLWRCCKSAFIMALIVFGTIAIKVLLNG